MAIYFSKPGIMCAAGSSGEELWENVKKGSQAGIVRVKTATDEDFFAGRIDDTKLKPSSARYDMRIMRIEEAALNQIENEINLVKNKYGADKIAVCIGSCDNGTQFSVAGHKEYFAKGEFPADYNIEVQGADYVSTFIKEKFGLTGPASTFSTACSSSAGAIIKATEMIMAGIADAAVVGGIDIASDTVLIGFNSLEAVSSEITNPFSKNRHGITIGEAAVFFVITRENVFADECPVQLLGWGESADAYHATSPDPSGAGAIKSMKRALEKAGLKPSDIDYVNLHGTGTKFNDSMEAIAVDTIFGDIKVPVSTTKPITGHTLGAAAALEASICISAIKESVANEKAGAAKSVLPPQIWDGEQDPELPVINIVNTKTSESDKPVRICLSNSFAFGGANATLVIGVEK